MWEHDILFLSFLLEKYWHDTSATKVVCLKLQKFEFELSDFMATNVQKVSPLVFFAYFSYIFSERTPYKVLWCFSIHFSRTYEVTKFWMIKLFLYVSDIIHVNEHCGLHINFWNFWLKPLGLMMKKNHFKQISLLWSQVLFNSYFLMDIFSLMMVIFFLIRKHLYWYYSYWPMKTMNLQKI